MAKRNGGTKQSRANTKTPVASGDAMEQRVVAFAEQLGRIAGAVLGRAEGLADRGALSEQLASVRDGAARLLEQLTGTVTDRPTSTAAETPAQRRSAGRSGGKVDAPGKKHRKPTPTTVEVKRAGSQAAKVRLARPMAKTNRHRGRG